ncbi:MAG: preprotein translocase subunit SecA [Anaerolineae bacterium]
MLKNLFAKVVGDSNERELQRLQPLVEEINALEAEFQGMPDEAFPALTEEFRRTIQEQTADLRRELDGLQSEWERATDGATQDRLQEEMKKVDDRLRQAENEALDALLPRAFAAVREAARRTVNMRHFDVQLIGGIVLHQGKVAEMKTGEGKTLVATLPLYLNALTGRGAHLVTPNDYLSKFGVQWMGPVYHFLGMRVGVIQSAAADPDRGSFLFDPEFQASDDRYQNLRPCSRREAYQADVTYGTNNEFGFDYLRDNMVQDLAECVQRELNYAIVDEVDNILIDEARTPLIISGPAEESASTYQRFAQLVPRLREEEDYTVDEKTRVVTLTEAGINKIEKWLGIDNLYSSEHHHLTPYLDNALRAHAIYHRDRDYIVKDGEVIIVDEFTGRLMHGRRYSEGLHQAIEAKEGVRVQRESLTLATITFQNYFRMYRKLAGMTGTAATEAEELHKIYGLDVVVIPTHRPMIRVDHPDMVYKNEAAKFRAVVQEIAELHQAGRPVLVGTISIEKSEKLSEMLRRRGVPHAVLNAKQHEKEAGIIAQAGRSGAVTIATNMAGRGVDILLGGNPEGLAREILRRQGVDLTTVSDEVWKKALAEARAICQEDREKVVALGGLHVLGTERHEARRIDNQLRGRAGRQGDPGSSRFYVSLEDDLMRRMGGAKGLMDKVWVEEDMPIEHSLVTKSIEQAQIKMEGYNFDIRKHVLEYDDVVNKQREVIYAQRRQILTEPVLRPTVLSMVNAELQGLVNLHLAGWEREEWDLDALAQAVRFILPNLPPDAPSRWRTMHPDEIAEALRQLAEAAYEESAARLGRDLFQVLAQEGRTLADLEGSRLALERALYAAVQRKLGLEFTEEIKDRSLFALKRDVRGEVEQAFVEAMALQRDRSVMLRVVDNLWIRHLTDLDSLREGIGLRAFAQQDPLVAYKKEAHDMYEGLLASIQSEIARTVFHVGIVQQPARRPMRAVHPGAEATAAPARPATVGQKLGRNDPCWCGSGKKYKLCHMREDMKAGRVGAAEGRAVAATAGEGGKKHSRKGKRRR